MVVIEYLQHVDESGSSSNCLGLQVLEDVQ